MARSLNKVQLIGNLTRDPELRYTPNGTAVCSFGLATNRTWKTDAGEKHDEAEFHNIVSWNKLAELCSQFLVKGRKVYVEGRLATRTWTAQDGAQRNKTEIVISDMILLDSRRPEVETESQPAVLVKTEEPASQSTSNAAEANAADAENTKKPAAAEPQKKIETQKSKKKEKSEESPTDEVVPDDIPF